MAESGNPDPNNPYGKFSFTLRFSWTHPDGTVKELEKLDSQKSLEILKNAVTSHPDFDMAVQAIQEELNQLFAAKFSR